MTNRRKIVVVPVETKKQIDILRVAAAIAKKIEEEGVLIDRRTKVQ